MTISLTTLDVELLIQILSYVDDTAPKTTKAVSLVNKYLNATSKLVVHRHKTLVFVGPGLKSPLSNWRGDDLVLHGIRTLAISEKDRITVENAGPLSQADISRIYSGGVHPLPRRHQQLADNVQKTWDDLADFVCRISNLRTLTWNLRCPIPFAVLNALHLHHKRAELTITNWSRARDNDDHTDATEVSLANSTALTKIRASIWPNGSPLEPDMRLAAFKRIITCSPNLRFASVVRGPNIETPPEDQRRQFLTHKRPTGALRHLTLDGWDLSEQTLKEWRQYVDLSRLESVKCSRGVPDVSYFIAAPTLLPNLKQMSLNFSAMMDPSVKAAAESYIATCAPLTSLSLWSWANNVTLATILRHGPTLNILQLHERETLPYNRQLIRHLLTSKDIKAIKSASPKLKDFTFDLYRKTSDLDSELETHTEILEELSSWHLLSKLQIYYDLGIASLTGTAQMDFNLDSEEDDSSSEDGDAEEPSSSSSSRSAKKTELSHPEPSINDAIEAYLPKLWRAIYGGRPLGGRSLDVKFGEWEQKSMAGHPWAVAKTHWVVRPSERDDQADQCDIRKYGAGISAGDGAAVT